MSRIIVALSGGKASAWCADWAFKHYPKESIILYFNDTKWEHPDLYRFLKDLSNYYQHPIMEDSDGRNPEQVFQDEHFLGNNRVPLCSRILKAERLQNFYQDGDTLIFGISPMEQQKSSRLLQVYQTVSVKTGKDLKLRFPLIEEYVTPDDVNKFFATTGIKTPELYSLGFKHNNCSGGCVRAGKKSWKLLLQKLPEVFKQREIFEESFRLQFENDCSFLKDMTLKELRESPDENDDLETEEDVFECFGVCNTQN